MGLCSPALAVWLLASQKTVTVETVEHYYQYYLEYFNIMESSCSYRLSVKGSYSLSCIYCCSMSVSIVA